MLPSATGFVPSSPFRAPAPAPGLLEPDARLAGSKHDFFHAPATGKHPMHLRRSSSGAAATGSMNRGLSMLADAMGESPMAKSRPPSMRFVMNHDGMFTSTTGRSMVDDDISRRGSISATSEHHAYAHGTGTPKSKNANGGMITSILSPHPAVDASARFAGYFTTASSSSYLASSRGPATPPRMPHAAATAAAETASPSAPFRFASLALGEPAMQSSDTSGRAQRMMASAGSFEALSQLAQSHHRATSDAPWNTMNQLPITSGSLPIGDAKALTRYTSVTEALRPGSFTFASDGTLLPCTLPADVALVQPLLTAASHAMPDKAQTSTTASMILPSAIQAAKSSPLPIASTAKAPTVKSPLSVKRETAAAAAAATSHGIEHADGIAGDESVGVDTRRSARIASIETYQAESAAAAERLEGLLDACTESSDLGAGMGAYEPSTSMVRVRGRLTRAAPQKEKSRARLPTAASIDAPTSSVRSTSRAKGSKYADARREHELAAAEADGVPFELDETTINTRQFDAIIRRRGQRAEFDEYRRRIRDRGFLHESRSKHALRRVRGERGKFLSMEELAALEHAQMVARMAQEREQQGPARKRQKSQKKKMPGKVEDALAASSDVLLTQAQTADLCSAASAKAAKAAAKAAKAAPKDAQGQKSSTQAKPRKTPPIASAADAAVKKSAKLGRGGKSAPVPAVDSAAGTMETDCGNFKKFYDDDDSDSEDEMTALANVTAVKDEHDEEDDAYAVPRVGSKRKLSSSSSFTSASAFLAATPSRSESHAHQHHQSILPFGAFGTPLATMALEESAFSSTRFPRMSALHATSDNMPANAPLAVATFGAFGSSAWVQALPPQRAGSAAGLLPGAHVSTASSNVISVPSLPPSFTPSAAPVSGANEPARPILNLTASRIAAQREKFLRARGL